MRRRDRLRAARAPQDRRAAPWPARRPHCIRGKLRGDVPLLPALPAHPGCHRDIASPRCTAPALATDLPPTATDRPSERANQRPPPPPAGQQQASVRPGLTPVNGPLQPPGSKARIAIGGLARRSVLLALLLARGPACHSPGPTNPPSSLALIGRGFPRSAPEGRGSPTQFPGAAARERAV